MRRLYRRISPCRLCPRECGADRRAGKLGFCRAGVAIRLASATLHFGEEPPISGVNGSGTLFFSHCTLRCKFCQNWPISQQGVGREITIEECADRMLRLQAKGAHNINLVNPTHYWPPIAAAIYLARRRGLRIPILANTNGFEHPKTLVDLAPFVEIWLPDFKYADTTLALHCSGRRELPRENWRALVFLAKRVGPLRVDGEGLAVSGMLIRHLALPGRLSDTRRVLRRIKRRLGSKIPVSLMTQYFPAYKAFEESDLNRKLTDKEIVRLRRMNRRLGINRGWRQ